MKFYQKVLLSLLLAIVLELGWFQLETWRIRMDKDIPKNIRYTVSQMEPVNWKATEEGLISEENPELRIRTGQMRLYKIQFRFVTVPEKENSTLFFQTESGEIFELPVTTSKGRGEVILNRAVGPELCLNFDYTPGTLLSSAEIVINPTQLRISVSRIVAVVLIYICGSLLFRIQRMPDYTNYIQKKE